MWEMKTGEEMYKIRHAHVLTRAHAGARTHTHTHEPLIN